MDTRYGVGDYVTIVTEYDVLGKIEGVFRVAAIRPDTYEDRDILRVSLDDGTGMLRSVFYEDCEKAEGDACQNCGEWTASDYENMDNEGYHYCPKCGYLYGS